MVNSDVNRTDLVIILGSPASGKTTLARRLSLDLALPAFGKDDIKEALFDVLGTGDREWSRLLSEASFAALGRLARTQLAASRSCIVEGNWRPVHAPTLSGALAGHRARCAQIWCRAERPEIVRRFTSRARHRGHLDSQLASAELDVSANQPPAFIDLYGPRFVYESDSSGAYAELLQRFKAGACDLPPRALGLKCAILGMRMV
jgi:predicted kinase